MSDGSKRAVYASVFGNLGIAISMLIAAVFTGSVSMWIIVKRTGPTDKLKCYYRNGLLNK